MFQGKIAELKTAMYDVGFYKDTFTKTTREIAEYITSQYDNAAEFRIGMERLELTQLVEPTATSRFQCYTHQIEALGTHSKDLREEG
jgi:hypothetical protein